MRKDWLATVELLEKQPLLGKKYEIVLVFEKNGNRPQHWLKSNVETRCLHDLFPPFFGYRHLCNAAGNLSQLSDANSFFEVLSAYSFRLSVISPSSQTLLETFFFLTNYHPTYENKQRRQLTCSCSGHHVLQRRRSCERDHSRPGQPHGQSSPVPTRQRSWRKVPHAVRGCVMHDLPCVARAKVHLRRGRNLDNGVVFCFFSKITRYRNPYITKKLSVLPAN